VPEKFLMLAVRLMFTVQLGTPRGRYDEYSSKVFPQSETKVYRSEGEEAKRLKVMLASLRQLRTISKAPRPSFALRAAMRNLLIRPYCITILYHNLLLFIDIFHI
jgi:hypothetical protein